ncbi:MAG: hypothetical protein PHF44_04390, partial [Candidatus Pacebacteria bacterium]|nr:hypothetical protein [Candidatus Paceibacterota bacterium]
DASGIKGYYVYRGGLKLNTTPTTATNYSDISLGSNTTYSYQVSAVDNSNNESAKTATINATTPSCPDTVPPTTPTSLSATPISCTQINLTWAASSDASGIKGYYVYRGGLKLNTTPTTATNYSDISLGSNTTYSYQVSAVDNSNNESAKTATINATTPSCPDTVPPTTPTSLSATPISCTQINLTWAASSDASGIKGYYVYRGGLKLNTTPTTATNYSDISLGSNTTYSYQVSAVDNSNNESAKTATINATTPSCGDTTAPSVPTGLSATAASCSQINLSWRASSDSGSGMKGYYIYRGGTKLNSTPVAATSYSDIGLSGNTNYSYQVSAVDNSDNESAKTSSYSITTPACSSPDTIAPSVPTYLTPITSGTTPKVALSWAASTDTGGSGLKGYKVYRNGTLLAQPTATSYDDTTVVGETSYTYGVSAIDNAGNESAKASVTIRTPFYATEPKITVVYPNGGYGGEEWGIGKTYAVKLSCYLLSQPVNISLYDGFLNTYTTLRSNVTCNSTDLSYDITVPLSTREGNAAFKIKAATVDGLVSDMSDNWFHVIGTPAVPCVDSDSVNYLTKGKASGLLGVARTKGYVHGENPAYDFGMRFDIALDREVIYDHCYPSNPIQVVESFCDSNGLLKDTLAYCPTGYTCNSGACQDTTKTAGKLTFAIDAATPPSGSVMTGTNATFAKISVSANATENVSVKQILIAVNLGANASSGAIKNISLWDGATQIGSTVPQLYYVDGGASAPSKYKAVFDLFDTSWNISASSVKTLTVKADVTSYTGFVSGTTISFGIDAKNVVYSGATSLRTSSGPDASIDANPMTIASDINPIVTCIDSDSLGLYTKGKASGLFADRPSGIIDGENPNYPLGERIDPSLDRSIVYDRCISDYILNEGFCDGNVLKSLIGTCAGSNRCQNGACQNLTKTGGQLSISLYSHPDVSYIRPGDTDVTFVKIKLAADATENLSVQQILVTARMYTPDSYKLFKNISIWDGATQIGSTAGSLSRIQSGASTYEYKAVFDLFDSPWIIPASGFKILTIKADAVLYSGFIPGDTVALGIDLNNVVWRGNTSERTLVGPAASVYGNNLSVASSVGLNGIGNQLADISKAISGLLERIKNLFGR